MRQYKLCEGMSLPAAALNYYYFSHPLINYHLIWTYRARRRRRRGSSTLGLDSRRRSSRISAPTLCYPIKILFALAEEFFINYARPHVQILLWFEAECFYSKSFLNHIFHAIYLFAIKLKK